MALIYRAFLLAAVAALASLPTHAQTDVAASLYGAFSGPTTGPSTSNTGGALLSPSNAAGALIEVRHIRNPLVGYEVTYAYNRANQSENVTTDTPPPCPVSNCLPRDSIETVVPANAHALTGDWVASLELANFRPFALAGGGVLFHVPAAGTVTTPYIACSTTSPACEQGTINVSTNTQTTGVFVYGAGVDWGLLPHLGLRLQYRGNVYKLSSLLKGFSSESAFTHSAEPMLGLYCRF